jgi:hypothetical protein
MSRGCQVPSKPLLGGTTAQVRPCVRHQHQVDMTQLPPQRAASVEAVQSDVPESGVHDGYCCLPCEDGEDRQDCHAAFPKAFAALLL